MRISVSHNKTRQEVIRIIDESASDLYRGFAQGPVQISDAKKEWRGSIMDFSFRGKMGFFSTSITGTVEVTDKDVVIEFELPDFVKRFIPEEKVRSTIETRTKALLEGETA